MYPAVTGTASGWIGCHADEERDYRIDSPPVSKCPLSLIAGFTWHSVSLGVAPGIVVTGLRYVRVRANHRRRMANGTSASFSPPR